MMRLLSRLAVVAFTASLAQAQLTVPGADGSDGPFNPSGATYSVDLSKAASAAWNAPSPVAGSGVYDASKWAVVYKYTSVNIPPGTTVKFSNHPSGAPVVWLVSGSVTIDGTISLDGSAAVLAPDPAPPGPGGFASGRGYFSSLSSGSAGFGPGGASHDASVTTVAGGGSFRTAGGGIAGPLYGSARLIPLVGGSGASPWYNNLGCGLGWNQPGAGGGAILIACVHSITLSGGIHAAGGAGTHTNCGSTNIYGASGAGGGIRLVADSVTGSGTLRAQDALVGLRGGDGCIALKQTLKASSIPAFHRGHSACPVPPQSSGPRISLRRGTSGLSRSLASPCPPILAWA